MLYQGLDVDRRPPDRYEEFKAWAARRYPGLLDAPEMNIPNQPRRLRELLEEWRRNTGLPPPDDSAK